MKVNFFSAESFQPEQFNPLKENIAVVVNGFPEKFSADFLTEKELLKANSFFHEKDKNAFAWRHSLLNKWLSEFTRTPFHELEFETAKEGKLSLKNSRIHFNISRSENYLAFAFGPQPLGIDIETLRDAKAFAEVADQHYHPHEKAFLNDNSALSFFTIWTRKEALLKAAGTGLTDELSMIDTTSTYNLLHNKRYNSSSFNGGDFLLSIAYESEIIQPVILCDYEIKNTVLSGY